VGKDGFYHDGFISFIYQLTHNEGDYLMSLIKKVSGAALTLSALFASSVQAALPTTADPTNAPSSGNYIELLKGYAFDIGIVVGLIIGTIAFIVVANNMIGTYKEIGDGRKTWGDMGMHGAMGVLLLVFVVYLLTEAAKVMF